MNYPNFLIYRHASISQLKGSTLWRERSMHSHYLCKPMPNLDGLHLLKQMDNEHIIKVTELVVAPAIIHINFALVHALSY